jgi:glycosyltransferase involved in cell wall biosynthesis
MRVCMIGYASYGSGARIRQYATALAQRGDSVDVIALRRQGGPAFEVVDGVNLYRIQEREVNERSSLDYLLRTLRFFLAAALLLARKHLSSPYNVLYIHSVPDFQVFAALVPKLLGARIILDIHDILPELPGLVDGRNLFDPDPFRFPCLALAWRLPLVSKSML